MTTTVEAIYQGGVFKPVRPVDLPENQRVQLRVEAEQCPDPNRAAHVDAWLAELRRLRQELFDKHGLFPDSTELIREDRYRDV